MELWYPGNSLAEKHENQQHANVTECTPDSRKQKRRKQPKIEKRKEPTINFQVLESPFTSCPEASPTDSIRTSGYSTIESTSSNGLDKYDNWKDHQEESIVCGWKEDEDIAKQVVFHQTNNDSRNTVAMPQVRSVSDRLYSSRLNTQMSKKREKYRFSHAATPEEHMQLYKESCSYSYLLLFSRSRPHTVATTGGGELLEDQVLHESTSTECDDKLDNHSKPGSTGVNRSTRKNYLPKPVTALSTTRDTKQTHKHDSEVPSIPTISGCKYSNQDRSRVLHALANRLGVRESIDEPKLVSAITRPTVPSITRKKSEDFRLQPAERTKESKEESSSLNSQNHPDTKQSKQRRTPHQLPKMPASNHHRRKSTSSISLSKYFHVNKRDSGDQSMLVTQQQQVDQRNLEDEGEEDIPINSNATSRLPSPDELDKEDLVPCEAFPQFVPIDPLGSSNQKELVIRRKANSLGLMSHKWAKNFIERGFMDGQLPRKVFYEYSKQSREATAAKKSPKHDSPGKHLSTRQNEKLKELKELYSPSANSKKSAKPKEKERVISGINQVQYHSHVSSSRPVTRSKANSTLRMPPPTRPRCSSKQRSRTEKVMAEAELEAAVKKLQEFKLQGLTHKMSTI